MKCALYTTFMLVIAFILTRKLANCEHDEDTWVEPNAWAREKALAGSYDLETGSIGGDDNILAGGSLTDNTMALTYLKKFIAHLFNREKLEYDAKVSQYHRTVMFVIEPAQLEQLERLNDPRDLDSVLTEIFSKAHTPNRLELNVDIKQGDGSRGPGIVALILDIFKDFKQLMKISEVQFSVLAASVILFCWYLHRYHHISVIVLIIGVFFISGYFITYLECNKKLEIEQMLEVIERDRVKTPSEPRWYTPIVNLFSKTISEEQQLNEKIKKSAKLNLAYCRPDHVFLLYTNELFLKQLEYLIEKCSTTMVQLKNSFYFPFNYMAIFVLMAMIAYIIKLTFKYILSPRAWAALLQGPRRQSHSTMPQRIVEGPESSSEDRLSGENLKMLLNAFNATPNVFINNSANMALPGSGVEEIVEKADATPPASLSSSAESSKSNSPEDSQNNNKEILKVAEEKTECRIEDENLPDDIVT